MNIGENIKKIRTEKGLKQSELADKAGISRVAIGNYERGDRQPNIEITIKIATALGVPVSELVERTEEKALADALFGGDLKEVLNVTLSDGDIEYLKNKCIQKYAGLDKTQREAELFFNLIYYIISQNFSMTLPERYNLFNKLSKDDFYNIANLIKVVTIERIKQLNIIDINDGLK